MNPISPPARPHIAVHSTHFSSTPSTDWDDAWDSGSDSEEPRQTIANPWKRSASGPSSTAPKQVPRSSSASSSSTLAFSYTHVNAPNPGSYPTPKTIEEAAPRSRAQNGWTIVRTSSDRKRSHDGGKEQSQADPSADADVEGDMILGDLDQDFENGEHGPSDTTTRLSAHSKQMAATVREDAGEIVNGNYAIQSASSCLHIPSSTSASSLDPLLGIRQRLKRRDESPAAPRQPQKQSDKPHDDNSEKLMRERSIRTNRRHKFFDCLTGQDVNICTSTTTQAYAHVSFPYLRPIRHSSVSSGAS